MTGTASVHLDGTADGERGSIGFSNVRDISIVGNSLWVTFVETEYHEGKPVRATIHVSVSPGGFSLSIDARRSDGLSASASLYGSTTSFEVEPLVQGPPDSDQLEGDEADDGEIEDSDAEGDE